MARARGVLWMSARPPARPQSPVGNLEVFLANGGSNLNRSIHAEDAREGYR